MKIKSKKANNEKEFNPRKRKRKKTAILREFYILLIIPLCLYYFIINRRIKTGVNRIVVLMEQQKERINEYLNLSYNEKLTEIIPKHEIINPFFSIIIPFNNRNKTIKKTILSIQNQNYKNYEIICVDDNSNDTTIDIIKGLSKIDRRIKIVKNSGQSGPFITRLNGMKIAKGNYIYNLDSDDMITLPEALEFLYNVTKIYNVDTIEFNSICGEIGKYKEIQETINSDDEYGKILYGRDIINRRYTSEGRIKRKWYGFVWTKIIKKEIVNKLIMNFELIGVEKFKNWYYAEDQYFSDILRIICNSYLHIDKIYHFHYLNPGSLTGSNNPKKRFKHHYKYCAYFDKLIQYYKLDGDFLIPNVLVIFVFSINKMILNVDECKLFYSLIIKIKNKTKNEKYFHYHNIAYKIILERYYKYCG